MSTSELLMRAADIIGERGWRQGVCPVGDPFDDPDIPVCMMDAVDIAVSELYRLGTDTNWKMYDECRREILKRIDHEDMTPERWNDADWNFEDEVLAVLRDETYAPSHS